MRASVGLRDLGCLRMYASGFPRFFAEPTPLVRDQGHFLALLGCAAMFAVQQIGDGAPVLRTWARK